MTSGRTSSASPGCHGFAHPVTKRGKELLPDDLGVKKKLAKATSEP